MSYCVTRVIAHPPLPRERERERSSCTCTHRIEKCCVCCISMAAVEGGGGHVTLHFLRFPCYDMSKTTFDSNLARAISNWSCGINHRGVQLSNPLQTIAHNHNWSFTILIKCVLLPAVTIERNHCKQWCISAHQCISNRQSQCQVGSSPPQPGGVPQLFLLTKIQQFRLPVITVPRGINSEFSTQIYT